ncbi:MAG TPA: outer membrane beta-barrel protein [Blastocatellia bacterium]|jgi:opacity protein-like surface antigen|nr:outer membrane beta-barrel protein [Blastocatellia bacterium]
MRKMLMFAAVILAAAISVRAQDGYPTNEIFGGYSYLSSETGFDRDSLHGWGLGFSVNPSSRWGVIAEFSGHYGKTELSGSKFDISTTTFLFGPRVSARGKTATAFGHVLLGGAKSRFEGSSLNTRFAMAVGGGVDVNLSRRFALRAVQADYLPIRADGEWQHNLRLQSGLVFRFGGN